MEPTGFIYDVDWPSGAVRRKLPVPDPREWGDNTRGGNRGGRGVAATPHGLIVANFDTLLYYDDDWNLIKTLTHPLFANLHEIDWDGDYLWATVSKIDLVLRIGLDGEGTVRVAWDPHVHGLAQNLGRIPFRQSLGGSVDYRLRTTPSTDYLHVNSVRRRPGGMIINCGFRPSASGVPDASGYIDLPKRDPSEGYLPGSSLVVSVDDDGATRILVLREGHIMPTHNGSLIDEARVAINDSSCNTLRICSATSGQELQALPVPGTWLRGLVALDAATLLVGTSPATIVQVDLENNLVARRVQLSEDPMEAIHGLIVCPRNQPPGAPLQ